MDAEQQLLDELTDLINEEDDPPYAVIAFVVRDGMEAQSVKFLASMPPNSVGVIRSVLAEAMDTIHEQEEDLPSDADFLDRTAICLCGCRYDELSERVMAIWEFNDNAVQLFDSLVSSNLARDGITDWYWQLRAFLAGSPYVVTPELRQFMDRGPRSSGKELASMIFLVMATLVDIDPNNPPTSLDQSISDEAANKCADFLDDVIGKLTVVH
jgi:hypothetical protein